jgi:CRISPR-associated protein Cmr6
MTTRQAPSREPPTRRAYRNPIDPPADAHTGLWLERYIYNFEEPRAAEGERPLTPQQRLVQQTATLSEPQAYPDFFHKRWLPQLANLLLSGTGRVYTAEARARDRIVIGVGAESVLETAISLHRTYGVPYLPGSALKGVAAAYARRYLGWSRTSDAYITLFGTAEHAGELFGSDAVTGFVTFFDALYMPGSGFATQALHPDVLTVHHPDYYQREADPAPPADWDNPTPIPFLTATGRYRVVLAGPEQWVQAALDLLRLALGEIGIGSKTAAGYGRMDLTAAQPLATFLDTAPHRQASSNLPAVNISGPTVDQEPEEPEHLDEGSEQPAHLALPSQGSKLRGVVFAMKEDGSVWVQFAGYDETRVQGVIPPASVGTKRYQIGADAGVIVEAIRRSADGQSAVLILRPSRAG